MLPTCHTLQASQAMAKEMPKFRKVKSMKIVVMGDNIGGAYHF